MVMVLQISQSRSVPVTDEFNSVPVIPADDTLTPPDPTVNVEPSACTATVAVEEPSYVKSAIPLPSVKSGKSVVPVNAPANEPVKLPVIFVSATPPEPDIILLPEVNFVDVTLVKPANVVDVAPKSISVEPIVTLSFVKAEFATFASVPPNVIDPEVVTVPVNVRPLTVPVPPIDVTVPEPKPVAAMLIEPAPFVTVIFEPPVIVANTGSPPVLPTTN